MTPAQLTDAARAWMAQDPDPETRAELEALLADGGADALADLRDRFETRLLFGTAGLRGRLGAGPNRMNRVVVAQTTAGLARFLLATERHPSVVVGCDGRKNSAVFAQDAAEVLAGAGIRAILLPRLLPTPVLAFAVRHLQASAGVMITASHNPAEDNGYKLYLGGESAGSQIVPPADSEVLTFIEEVVAGGPADRIPRFPGYEEADERIVEAYVAATAVEPASAPSALRWVYTPLHGVGWETAERVFDRSGFPAPVPVTAQLQPDATFPTVAFPNPEEKGALDLALATADAEGIDVVVANDPDADRLAAAIRGEAGWQILSGNQLGLLLGWACADRARRDGRSGTLAASLVSTPGLRRIAEHYGLGYTETLTGFKWISRVPGLLFGFEEALGFLVDPDKVRDKDGISAAVAFLRELTELETAGTSFAEHQREFDATFGAFASAQISVRVTSLDQIAAGMTRLRTSPPASIGGLAVQRMDDLLRGGGELPPSDVLRFRLDGGARLIARPSGTEPKLKLYLDVEALSGSVEERRAAARATLDALRSGADDLLAG
ncbi:MAG: cpsG [Microbacteriaceae bacterium]|nr:cpsG [Microbacteriaceae bacterium]